MSAPRSANVAAANISDLIDEKEIIVCLHLKHVGGLGWTGPKRDTRIFHPAGRYMPERYLSAHRRSPDWRPRMQGNAC